ncbi:hypothetical protein JXA40_03200 [bacterium]|nr:hypothetical protein [candidate division CSSED10-310 bacterium]
MSCPRCGFPEDSNRCELCGLTDPGDFEMRRFRDGGFNRFEITLHFPAGGSFDRAASLLKNESVYRKTSGSYPRYYVFFEDGKDGGLFPFLETLQGLSGWELLINGRPRPYIQELWLPMLELLTGS